MGGSQSRRRNRIEPWTEPVMYGDYDDDKIVRFIVGCEDD